VAEEKSDNSAERDDAGGPEPKPERRVITLVQGEQTVVVEGPDDLQTMAEIAAYFWLLTSPPVKTSLGFGAGSTLVTERAEPYCEDRTGGVEDDAMG